MTNDVIITSVYLLELHKEKDSVFKKVIQCLLV